MAGEEDPQRNRINAARERIRAAVESAYKRFPQEKQRAADSLNGGLLGRIIGDSGHHAGSIAFISVLGLLIILLVTVLGLVFHMLWPPHAEIATATAALATASEPVSSGVEEVKNTVQSLIAVREAIELARDNGALSGNVEVDGAYFGGYVKPANEAKDRKDRRKKVHQSGKRQVVVVMRARDGRTMTRVRPSEADGVDLVRDNVLPGTVVYADEAAHWDKLAAFFPIKRINHQVAYSKDGANTNQAESFFSRLRRAEIGIHHHIAGRYLEAYATEMAWREDFKRLDNGTQYTTAVAAAAVAPQSARWSGYWQRGR